MDYETIIERSKKIVAINNQEEKVIYMILEHVLGKSLSYILSHKEETISEEKLEEFSELFSDYIIDEKPVEYILGYSYFYDLKLKVNKHVLIPRKETEEVVEEAIEILKELENLTIVDVGCGSGNISIALKKHLNNAKIYAVDISKEAIKIAKENATENDVLIEFIEGNLLDYFIDNNLKVDAIISNPPYISKEYELDNSIKNHEPNNALFANEKGMEFYQKILKSSKDVLNKDGIIIFEIGFDQKELITKLIKEMYPKSEFTIKKDIGGNNRTVIIKTKKLTRH